MDNLTHSMTAAVAAKFVRKKNLAAGAEPYSQRAIFWLLVASVNFPDLDVVMLIFGDPILTIKTHRWVTHSLIGIPFFAVIPAAVFYRFSSIKDFRFLWLTAQLGILLHICCDLVTPYGTQLFAPFSVERFTLGSMFIIDLYFSFGLMTLLLLGRLDARRRNIWRKAALAYFVGFIVLTFTLKQYADARVHGVMRAKKIAYTKISTLPQPLSIFRWVALVQTETGVRRAFFSLFDGELEFEDLRHTRDPVATAALKHQNAQWYMSFAHHPLIHSYKQGGDRVIEIYDLQFSPPPWLVKAMASRRPRPPFTLQLIFSNDGQLKHSAFNE